MVSVADTAMAPVYLVEEVVGEGIAENSGDQVRHGAPAGAVGEVHPAVLHVELAAVGFGHDAIWTAALG